MSKMWEWLQTLGSFGYIGIFLMSFISASAIFIPIPYTVALLAISATGQFNLFLLALATGLGAATGELVGYGLGYLGRRYVKRKYGRRFDAMVKLLNHRYYGPIAVFVFALTPLPDDLLFVPLGLLHYNLWKVFIPCVLGKFLMSFIIVYVGSTAGQLFVDGSPIIAIVTVILLVVTVTAMFKINWEKVVTKYLPKETKKRRGS